MPTPIRFGPEFLVNTTTTRDQFDAGVLGLSNGRIAFTFTDNSGANFNIRTVDFTATGNVIGSDRIVNTTRPDFQGAADMAELAGGGRVVVFTDRSGIGDTDSTGIRARLYNDKGNPVGEDFLVNTETTRGQYSPAVTALADGGFFVVWEDDSRIGGDTSLSGIKGQRFDQAGNKVGGEILINTGTQFRQVGPEITTLANGRFVVTWDGSGNAFDIYGQMFNADGTRLGNQFLVNSTTRQEQRDSVVTDLADGGFVIAWSDSYFINPTINTQFFYNVRFQRFDANGQKMGGETVVKSGAAFEIYSVTGIAGLPDGRFVVVYNDYSETGDDISGGAVRARLYEADGTPSGDEFLVNTTTSDSQTDASVSALADGRFVISWTDNSETGGDTDGSAIRGQIFDARDAAISLVGTNDADHYVGTRFGDTIAGAGGNDRLDGNAGDDLLRGGNGSDDLRGGNGSDRLDGGNGNDILFGGNGNDRLIGSFGTDTLNGGAGADVFIFADTGHSGLGSARDIIQDFARGEDRISLAPLVPGELAFLGTGTFTGSGPEVRINQTASGVVVQIDADGDGRRDMDIFVRGVATLTADDFIL